MKKTSLWVAVSILAAACGGTATVAPPPVAKPLVAPVAKVSVCERTRPNTGPVRLDTRRQSGVVALAKVGDSTIAYVADSDDESLQTYDVDAGKLLAVTRLGAAPEHVLVLSDGRVAVTMRNQNRVQLLEPHADAAQPLTGLCSLRTPAEPVAMALTVDDSTLLVTSAFAHKLTGYNSLTGAKRFIQNLPREPRAVLVDDDGQRAFVAHVIGGHVSVVDLAENATEPVRQIDMRVPKLFGTTNNDPLRSSCQGFALAKSFMTRKPAAATHPALPGGHHAAATSPALALKVPSGRLFVPRVTIEGGDATQRTEGYGGDSVRQIEEPIVTVVDSLAERNMTRTVSDIAGTSGRCLLPRAAVVSGNSGSLLLTCLGSDTVVELDAGALDPSQSQRRQWPVPAGPTGLALDDNKGNAVVWSQFERRLSVLDLNSKESQITTVVAPRLS
ncbi:MAG TPA: hypothetical protein ENK23_05460, partial [Sorangium sp.]|nr:hypothetical protein [Sorangium sp.]